MNEPNRFNVVFAKLQTMLEEDAHKEPLGPIVRVHWHPEVTCEELDQIDEIRRSVFEVTETEPMSFTTT